MGAFRTPARAFAVLWREAGGPTYAGALELGSSAVTLEGSGPCGARTRRCVPYADLAGARMGRAPAERLLGRPSVVLDRRAAQPILVAAIRGLGLGFEPDELLDKLQSRRRAETGSVNA